MAKVLDRPTESEMEAEPPEETPTMLEAYRAVCTYLPDHRVELVDGRIVVNPVPTDDHNDIVSFLILLIAGTVAERGWRIWTNIKCFLGSQEERYIPDLAIVPRDRRMWGKDHVYGDSTLLAVEVVSPSSVHDDYVIKPDNYACGGVPLYLLIDPMKGIVRLYSNPSKTGYRQQNEVPFGEALELPEPWNLTMDTGELVEPEPSAGEGE
ncbi:Uma2 family endonuclease [Nonomuraea sp. NPDC050556]|uniref:Uma2 family endonuclease n=1 Tax=Nonomuraea sp. NPDC050556 TaxID=3364369 RepID=UPI0037B137FB